MNNSKDNLRKQAESRLSIPGTEIARLSTEDVQKLLYEFQVHQIELELQNEELKNSQHELMVSRDRYAMLYNLSQIGYLTLNEAGVIQAANPAAAQLLGTSPSDLMDKKFGQFINPSDQDSYYFFIQAILIQRTEQTFITRFSHCNGKFPLDCQGFTYCGCFPESCNQNDGFIYVECRGIFNALENDEPKIYLSLFNITEAKTAHKIIACLNEELEQKVFQQTLILSENHQDLVKKVKQLKIYKQQLIERETKITAIFNAAVEGIITINMSGIIVSVNYAVDTIFGYNKEELINRNIDKLIPLSQHKDHAKYLEGIFNDEPAHILSEIREVSGVRKDGSIVPLDISMAQFFIDGTRYLANIVRDVTSRKLQEKRDQEHVDELAHVTRLGLMGEMASGIAHQVNQPLAAIANYTKACINLLQNEHYDRGQLTEILQKTNQQALKAGQIIHHMRDFVKSKKIHRAAVDSNSLIHDAVGLCESYLKENSISLTLDLIKDPVDIFVDRIQIEQVLLNLIRNSIDALATLPPLRPRNLSIQTVIISNNLLEVKIKDNGPGIDSAEQKNILTPFYTTKSDGMGMGLSICRSLIEAHEGTLHFNSKPEKGTTFYFTIPLIEQANGS